MNPITARKLSALNTRFYAANAASFSQTRTAPWQGWRRCLEACGIEPGGAALAKHPCDASAMQRPEVPVREWCAQTSEHTQPCELSVLDIACGNLRFEAFLLRECPHIDWRLFAIDNCEPLVESSDLNLVQNVEFTCEDIVENLLAGLPGGEPANTPELAQAYPFDLVVSFGFMHHIPGFDLRLRFLLEALNQVKSGGYLAVSFWQFMNDETKRDKIEQTHLEALEYHSTLLAEEALLQQTEETMPATSERLALDPAELEEGDYLLGWKNLPGQYRYCHHFSNREVDRFIAELASYAHVVVDFNADGKTGDLNRYVVFQRS